MDDRRVYDQSGFWVYGSAYRIYGQEKTKAKTQTKAKAKEALQQSFFDVYQRKLYHILLSMLELDGQLLFCAASAR